MYADWGPEPQGELTKITFASAVPVRIHRKQLITFSANLEQSQMVRILALQRAHQEFKLWKPA